MSVIKFALKMIIGEWTELYVVSVLIFVRSFPFFGRKGNCAKDNYFESMSDICIDICEIIYCRQQKAVVDLVIKYCKFISELLSCISFCHDGDVEELL